VRFGKASKPADNPPRAILKYEAEKKEVERWLKTFVGVAANSGMTYNIQNAFHSQGYFGVKVTHLGANLSLLEGQEEGEVEALMKDAKDWLEQWFTEIRPWNPKDVDLERIIWLRVFGVPVHVWNDDFFTKITKPWGIFMHSDDVTNKKVTMDVARLLIRTSSQKAIDEFIDVQINGEFFHLRVLEDSYGPMRVMVTQDKGHDGRASSSSSSEADDEEDMVRLAEAAEEVSERESEGEGENLLALNVEVIANNSHLSPVDHGNELIFEKERMQENSNYSCNDDILNEEKLKFRGRVSSLDGGGINKEVLFNETNDKLLGQEVARGGPEILISKHKTIEGGVER
jgi:hypothetical protein